MTRDNGINTKGFTMLELLMVLVVIGVLASLAIPQFSSMAERAQSREAIQTINAIKAAEQLYFLEFNCYAETADIQKIVKFPTSNTTDSYYYYEIIVMALIAVLIIAKRTTKGGTPTAGQTITCRWIPRTNETLWLKGGVSTETL